MDPDVLEHPELGRLQWDEPHGQFMGRLDIGPGRSIGVALDPFTNFVPSQAPHHLEDAAAFAAACAERLRAVVSGIDAMAAYAAEMLLSVHNDGDWRAGRPIDKDEFVARLSVTDVEIAQDGIAEICFDDGDLFWGHAVFVRTDEIGRPVHAELFG